MVETNRLINLSKEISINFSSSEYDTLVAAGEQISCSLIAGRLEDQGHLSRSWLSWQIPILTIGNYSYSRIESIYKKNIINFLKREEFPLLQFQRYKF